MAEEGEAKEQAYELVFEGDETKFTTPSKDGKGKAIFPNMDTYEGEYKGGKRNGSGAYAFADGKAKYVGEYKDSLKHGKGAFTYASGAAYDGEWLANKYEGLGTYKW